jgi:hypothetical protein
MAKVATPRWGWALTGSGHLFRECLVAIRALENVDLFFSKAASEVLRMYKQDLALPTSARIFRDTTASSPPVGYFYYGVYHTLVLAPATSNTVTKCVYGISLRQMSSRRPESVASRRSFCLRYGTGTRNRSTERNGQGLSASHRSREYPTD